MLTINTLNLTSVVAADIIRVLREWTVYVGEIAPLIRSCHA
jgi:hypothetical protein